MTRRCGAFSGVLLALLAAIAPEISAAPIPTTAYSLAVQTPSPLTEDAANAFRFPQLMLEQSSSLSSYGAARTSSSGAQAWGSGVQIDFDSQALTHTFQRNVESGVARRTDYPVFQLAWAGEFRGLRVGAAYAWGTVGEKQRHEQQFFEPSSVRTWRETEFRTVDYRLLTAGLTWKRKGFSIDAVVDGFQEDLAYEFLRVSTAVSPGSLHQGIDEIQLEADGGFRLGGAVRMRFELGRSSYLRTFASYQDASHDVAGFRKTVSNVGGSVGSEEHFRVEDHDPGQTWAAGLSFGGQHGKGTWMTHVYYASRRGPWAYTPSQYSWIRTRVERDEAQAGIAFEIPVRWSMTLRSSAKLAYFKEWQRNERLQPELEDLGVRESLTEVDERFEDGFAWGLSRAFGALELATSLSTNLNFSWAFLGVDLVARF